ncbi:NAD(P)/FAD-dependent oxidoreductase [Candidatus Babeliales bacterium]|nr:NAD(P)/FAD-dependent oxidoreductase [Candidatus Babeliales bacterium]MBP9844006.1 NAD(P)/FAD-dependent oxidoreductase [Candidatus Babeliales bacterium]
MKKIVVIGASAASIGFVAKLRSFDSSSQVICFSGEKEIPYNRCLLADFVEQAKNFDDIQLKSENFFQDHHVDLRLNSWVTAIDKDQKFVVCNGQQESYDYLFIGTGTSPFIPKIEGIDLPGVFGFHNFSDVHKLDDFIQDQMPKTAVVVGAGINGVEAASALVSRGLKVSIVDLYETVMPMQVDHGAAQFIEGLMRQAGVALFKGQKVVALQTRTKASVGRVKFESGACLPIDCVVFATGSRVNSSLIAQAGLNMVDGSLLVNDHMQTSDEFIFAGGDICVARDIVSKDLVKSVTWSDAMLAGLTAATQLSDTPRTYPGIVGMRDSEFFGLEFYGCGQTVDVELFTVIEHHKKDFMHKFYLFDGKLQGFILIGRVENLAKYRTFYLTQQVVEESDFVQE